MRTITEIKEELNQSLSDAYKAVRTLVEKNGGYIDTNPNKGFDTIYGYVYDDGLDEVSVVALRVKDGDLQCYLKRKIDEAKSREEIESDDYWWYALNGMDGELYATPTLMSILDAIEEYV